MYDLLSKVKWVGVRLGCGIGVGVVFLLVALVLTYT